MIKRIICCVLSISCIVSGCLLPIPGKSELSPQSSYPPGMLMNADTIGLLEAFREHKEIRALLIQAASGSISLLDDTNVAFYAYDDCNDGTGAYYEHNKGAVLTDESLRVDKTTAEAIAKIEELLPGVSVRMLTVDDERMCVFFSIVKNTTGKDGDYYQEDLTYTLHDLSDLEPYGYYKVEDNWYFKVAGMV